jgi:hypothetical protein
VLSFDHIKRAVAIDQVATWLDIKTHREGGQLRGYCCFCDKPDNPRALAITPSQGVFKSFCPHHQYGGSCIDLAAAKLGVSLKEAAKAINAHFRATTPENKPVPTPDDVLQELPYLTTDHELLIQIGLNSEAAKSIGAGYAPRGTMRGRLCWPIRDRSGRLLGYIGWDGEGLLLPKQWRWGPQH